jgi:next-to-BRCA1 protein 1
VDSASNASDYVRSSGTSIPLRSPVLDPFKSGNVNQTGVSNSEPVALQEALSNLSLSQAATSREVFRTFADMISKKHLKVPLVAGPSSKNDVPKELATPEARGPQYPYLNYVDYDGNRQRAGINASRLEESRNVGVDLNTVPSDPSSSTNVNRTQLSSAVPVSDDKGKASIDDSFAGKVERCGTSINSAVPNNIPTKSPAVSFVAPNECPFSGTHTLHSMPPPLGNFRISPFKRSHGHTDAMNGMFHKGVCCDGCGVYPITGPRFKSKVKVNYDLCSICINEIGNQTDYIRMDRPSSFRAPRCSYQNTKEFRHHPKIPPPIFKTGSLLKHARTKLDSRFILDVNVIDGTMMAPFTAFTKIWRMRNNGTMVWPKGTQLVWIGGDKLSDLLSVDLEVPDDGVPIEKELDVAVDFRAPQLPGRYISYWRMASLSGHKFGQRVWVLIQVDDSLKDSFYDSSQSLNLNIPLGVGSSSEVPRVIDINVQPIEDTVFHQSKNPNAPPEPLNQMVDEEQRQELGNEFPTMETTFVPPAASAPASSVEPSSVSYPIIDFSGTAPAVPSNQQTSTSSVSYPIIDLSGSAPDVPSYQQTSTVDALPSSLGMNESNFAVGTNENEFVEEVLLKELEEMGFKQVDLNKKVLRWNEYDLEQSVEELCGVSEWDPLLHELHEMGFHDDETNKRLLKKNNGSIKRVVMNLINGELV